MLDFKTLYEADRTRYGGHMDGWNKWFHYNYRKSQTTTSNFMKRFYRLHLRALRRNRCLDIPSNLDIGKGLYLGHPYNITINESAVIGENVNINKGVTIGQENRGDRKGTPVLGNMVWCGTNSIIVGNIVIGDDVLIAPGSFVNCDVPSHSIVIGNPCRIITRENATSGYIENIVI